jgi:hypothetical protein
MTSKKAQHPVMEIQNVSLETFEKAVYAHDYENASRLMLEGLQRLKTGAEFVGYTTDPNAKTVLYTRWCAAMFALLCDPNYSLSQEGFDAIASENAIIDMLFRCSVFGTSDHMMPQFADDPTEKDTNKIRFKDSAGLLKFLITYSMRSGFRMNFAKAFGDNPQTTFALYIGLLTTMIATSKDAEDRREELLKLHNLFNDVNLTDRFLSPMSDAYMYCSYAHGNDKHAVKGLMHSLYSKMLLAHGFTEPKFKARKVGEKPTILIPVEWFTSLHAMYRCYAPLVRQLRTKFRVVGIGRPHAIDDVSKKEFDAWYTVPEDKVVLNDIGNRIKGIKPDVIWYPSLGMDLVWVALSSVRLAPVQLMTLGHPASSRSPCMDYAVCEEGDVKNEALFTEKLVNLPLGSMFRFVMRPDADLPVPFVEENPEVIKIAIPAMVLKLNATFLSTLKEIQDKCTRKVEFHFWPNMITTVLNQTAKEIREYLPGAFTYERSQYNHYMRQMQACHIQLGTFPFGGTNSNVDSMLLGSPLACMEACEPHATSDAKMLRRAGMPEWLIAHTREEYVAAAVRLIDNDTERVALSRYLIDEADITGKFLSEPPAEFATSFVDAVWKLCEEK